MKKAAGKIGQCVLVYIIVILLADVLFSLVYYSAMMETGTTFQHVYIQTIAGKLKMTDLGDAVSIVQAIQNLVEVIAAAILTGYVLTYFTHRQPKVNLVDYLVIRRRTSENVKNQLSLGVMVLNKGMKKLERVECHISCVYVNLDNKSINAEYHNVQEVMTINNYMRFSFPLELLPRKLLRDYLKDDPYCNKTDVITITVTGEYGSIKSPFKIEKRYRLADIVIVDAKDVKYSEKIYNPFTRKEYTRVYWEVLERRPDSISEVERPDIIREIFKICRETV